MGNAVVNESAQRVPGPRSVLDPSDGSTKLPADCAENPLHRHLADKRGGITAAVTVDPTLRCMEAVVLSSDSPDPVAAYRYPHCEPREFRPHVPLRTFVINWGYLT